MQLIIYLSRFLLIVERLLAPCKAPLQWEAPLWNRFFRCCRWIISSTRWQQLNRWPLGYQILGTAHITYQHVSLIKQHISYFSRYPVHYGALCGCVAHVKPLCLEPTRCCGRIISSMVDPLPPDGSGNTRPSGELLYHLGCHCSGERY